MQTSPQLYSGEETGPQKKSGGRMIELNGIWVIVGFLFWFGFYLGALIMHAIHR